MEDGRNSGPFVRENNQSSSLLVYSRSGSVDAPENNSYTTGSRLSIPRRARPFGGLKYRKQSRYERHMPLKLLEADGRWLISSNSGWHNTYLQSYDEQTHKVSGRIELPAAWYGLAYDVKRKLVIASSGSGRKTGDHVPRFTASGEFLTEKIKRKILCTWRD